MKEAVQHGHRGIALKFGSIVASAHQPIYNNIGISSNSWFKL